MFKRLLVLTAMLLLGLHVVSAQSTLTVFAAASLTDAFTEIEGAFEAANPGVDVVYNFGSSSTLATQIVEGAPGDVFASANNTQMNVVRDAGLLAGSPLTFARNRLVLIVPVDNPAHIQGLGDLDQAGIQLVFIASGAPIRDYTETMLEQMAADPLYGEAYRSAVLANVVSEEETVRLAVAKVVLGEADAAIVYLSDVTPDISSQVIALPIPDAFNTIATYPAASLTASANPELAQAFVEYLLSSAGQDTLVRWNFLSVRVPVVSDTIVLVQDGNLHIGGWVLNPLILTGDDLRANYTAHTVEANYLSDGNISTGAFTGVLLWDIITSAEVFIREDAPNDALGISIIASSADGQQSVVALGEIAPAFGNQQVLVAYDQDGSPLESLRLVVPADQSGGRALNHLLSLEVRRAPQVSQ